MQKKRPSKIVIVIVLLLLISITYSIRKKKDYDVLKGHFAQEKEYLKADLDNMTANYKKLSTKNKKLTKRIIKEINKIRSLTDSVKNLNEDNFGALTSYRRKLALLQNENQILRTKVDSLKYVNTALREENVAISEILEEKTTVATSLVSKNRRLNKINTSLNEKLLEPAKKLKTSRINAVAMRERSSGKLTVTEKNNKTDAFRLNFKLLSNDFANPGIKKVCVQIKDGDNRVVGAKKKSTLNNNEEIIISDELIVDYNNKDLEILSLILVDRKMLIEGGYKINVFVDGYFTSSSVIVLE